MGKPGQAQLEEEADPVSSGKSDRDCGAAQSVAGVEAGNRGKPEAGVAGILCRPAGLHSLPRSPTHSWRQSGVFQTSSKNKQSCF